MTAERLIQMIQTSDLAIPRDEAIAYYIEEFSKEKYAPLKGRKILMVDDHPSELRTHIPPLLVATNGSASFIKFERKEEESKFMSGLNLAKAIMEINPEIILMDQYLDYRRVVLGTDVIQTLRDFGFKDKIIGFSSDSLDSYFKSVGADGSLVKSELYVAKNLLQIAGFITDAE